MLSYNNQRRVTRDIKRIYPADTDDVLLLCSDSLFGAGVMDGKLKVMRLAKNQLESGLSGKTKLEMTEQHFVETSTGVSAASFFKFPSKDGKLNQEFIVLGSEGGTIFVYDYTRFKS